jgi:hypothetical protein
VGPGTEGPFELRTGGVGLRLGIGLAAIALLLAAAVLKPWSDSGSGLAASGPNGSSAPTLVVAGATASAASGTAGPSASQEAADSLCPGQTGWQVVVDDVELGRDVRTWLTADVVYSSAQPAPATIPVTTFVSAGIGRLGFCRPPEFVGAGSRVWTGTIWREPEATAKAAAWQVVGRLRPLPGSLGAVASPIQAVSMAWKPGLYFLQADSAGSASAWLGVRIEGSPRG